jgi:hypothetical protein
MRGKSERIKNRQDDPNKDSTLNYLQKIKERKMRMKKTIDEHILKIETAEDFASHQFELFSMDDLITGEVLLDIYLHSLITFKKSIQDFRVKNLELTENMSQEVNRQKMKQILDYIRCIDKHQKAKLKKKLVSFCFQLNLNLFFLNL